MRPRGSHPPRTPRFTRRLIRATTPASVERGRALYIAEDCGGCHGPDGRKGGFLVDSSTNHPAPIRDLSAPWTFRGGSDPNLIWLRLTTGIGNSMPTYAYGLTPGQRSDFVNYVQSQLAALWHIMESQHLQRCENGDRRVDRPTDRPRSGGVGAVRRDAPSAACP